MAVIGWIFVSALVLFGLFVLGLYAYPIVAAKIKSIKYSIEKRVEDEKLDADKRSDARQHRDEIRRQKDFELKDKKLDARLSKVNKRIEILRAKLELAEQLERQVNETRDETPVVEEPEHEEPVVPYTPVIQTPVEPEEDEQPIE